MSDHPLDLDALRQEIVSIDRELLEKVARRNEIVRSIARAKMEAAEPRALFDRSRERHVYQRAHEHGSALGLPRALTQHLMESIIEASHMIQEQASRDAAHQRASSHAHILIIGGEGQMGRRFNAEFAARGHTIVVTDRDDDDATRNARVAEADIVMVAVPMEHQCAIIEAIAPHLRDDALLCDINSLKENVCSTMQQHVTCESLGLHPMFGPSVHSLRRQKVVVCDVHVGERATWMRQELAAMGMELVEAEAHQHDRMMAVIQVLVHFSTLVMGQALRRSGVDIEESLRFTSPIYRLELSFVSRLFAQNADLYAEIEMSNPHGDAVRQEFLDAASSWITAIQSGDHAQFGALYDDVAGYFRDFAGEAMDLSNRIIDTMVLQP